MTLHSPRFLPLMFILFLNLEVGSAQAPPTIQEALAREGVGSSESELINALHSPSSKIRSMAASQLAVKADKDALGALNEALGKAQDGSERLAIATAINSLGDSNGTSAMAKLCADTSVSIEVRFLAADRLQKQGSDDCFQPIVEMLASTNDPSLQAAELDYLTHSTTSFTSSSESYLSVVLRLETLLQSEVPIIRQRAAACIAKYHMESAESYLKEAIDRERDPETRTALQHSQTVLSQQK